MNTNKKILIFDNYDSFTYNLCNLIKTVRPNYTYQILRNNNEEIFTYDFDVLIISPGPMTPDKTGLLKDLFIKKIIPDKIPTLGICLGLQFLGYFYDTPVTKAKQAKHGMAVNINHFNKNIFDKIPDNFKAARYNSLEIDINNINKNELEILATEQNQNSIMALKHKTLPFVGVQFHPESFLTQYGDMIINNFFKIYVEN